jgi:hypothetical protein
MLCAPSSSTSATSRRGPNPVVLFPRDRAVSECHRTVDVVVFAERLELDRCRLNFLNSSDGDDRERFASGRPMSRVVASSKRGEDGHGFVSVDGGEYVPGPCSEAVGDARRRLCV